MEGSSPAPQPASAPPLTFHLPEAAELTRVRIVNGYAKSRAHLLDNAAARRIRIQAGDGGFVAATLPRAQARTIAARFGKARTVHITVLSGYRGDVDRDLAMSEVWFYARKG